MMFTKLGILLGILIIIIFHQTIQTTSKESFNILAVIPYDGKSHWEVFSPIFEELAKRGNNITVLGHFPRKIPIENYHDISIADDANPSLNSKNTEELSSNSNFKIMLETMNKGVESCMKLLQHPNIQTLINTEEKYDLVITEIFNTDCFLGFVYKFQVPYIALRSGALSPWANDRISNIDNPSYIPNSYGGKGSRMNFFQRFENLLGMLFFKFFYHRKNKLSTEIARKYFGHEMPSLEEMTNNVSLILTNTHPVHYIARPLVPGIKEIGGIHMPEAKPLPTDLNEWISGAAHGVIYFSLGSMLRTQSLSLVKRKAFFDAFAALPQRVLMKWEGNRTEELPANVRTVKWSPQFDVISHPNVKVFIYHGGMLGITEAVYAGIPMIVIPVLGDQFTNAILLEEKGFAISLRYTEITKESLLTAIKKILHDPSYKKTAQHMSTVIKDRLISPLDEAVYWIEYIARYQGAPWLKIPAHGMPLHQYLLLDVIGFALIILLILLLITWLTIRKTLLIFQTTIKYFLSRTNRRHTTIKVKIN